MKNATFILIIMAAMTIALLQASPSAQQNRSAEVLMGAGLHQEEVEGDLEAAIATYKKILADYPDNRPVAARALLRMGQCYEKQGNDEARRAYEHLVQVYADQSEPANAARARLAVLAGTDPATLTTRRLENPPEDIPIYGAISPDGRNLSFWDGRTGDLAVRDLQTGTNRRLTDEGTSGNASPGSVGASTWSSDSKRIAYAWLIGSGVGQRHVELRVVGIDGGKPGVLTKFEDARNLDSLTWSPDGKQIAATVAPRNGPLQMVLISTTDGSTRKLTELKREIFPTTKRFSPDGRYVAYDWLPDVTSPERDIFLMSIDTGHATPLVQHPADDYLLGWSRDGQWLVFASDRTGALGLWVVSMSGAKTQGEPRLVRPGIDKILPVGLTSEGALYYGVVRATEDVYIADLDSETGRVNGPPMKVVEHFEGGNFSPSYSRDGKYLAYVSRRGNSPYPTNGGNTLCVRSLDTGQERVFYREIWELGLRHIDGPTWSPDSRFIIFVGSVGKIAGNGIYRIDLETGVISRIINCGPDEGILGGIYGPDEKYFFVYGNIKQDSPQVMIRVRDIESGEEQELYRFSGFDMYPNIALSPDNRWLSFANTGWGEVRSLRIMPASGGAAREVYSFGEVKMGVPNISHIWAPDGRTIMFSTPDPSDLPSWDLWRVPVEGGKPEKMGLQKKLGMWGLTVLPDGRQLAFTGKGSPDNETELWVMENFLPPAPSASK